MTVDFCKPGCYLKVDMFVRVCRICCNYCFCFKRLCTNTGEKTRGERILLFNEDSSVALHLPFDLGEHVKSLRLFEDTKFDDLIQHPSLSKLMLMFKVFRSSDGSLFIA